MNQQYKMAFYNPSETMSENQEHTLLYSFQYGEATAQVITSVVGNISGGEAMDISLDCGFSVPIEHELSKKHVIFYEDEEVEDGVKYSEVEELIFYYPNGETVSLPIENCADYLIGIQIIKCEPYTN